ncbi:hypothetical protein TRIATDRAFT_310884 [Trichoderma atroviride IMI 206040]|uniref:Uncharacterized protein n=1 Tax=Hypocrea atroviridis (strain ATCC 20476 / IMI 206040) TaxID=452589 RepID=G9P1K6_HYPAI|nr:uncharacterized protein TRIATDRAFT_310884 [Trichoderma atroviride IMI 206040]EHK43340.1 hypothetical protein TRIATDRAFT_310884 [Trichoderma atroviride IMI 206040]
MADLRTSILIGESAVEIDRLLEDIRARFSAWDLSHRALSTEDDRLNCRLANSEDIRADVIKQLRNIATRLAHVFCVVKIHEDVISNLSSDVITIITSNVETIKEAVDQLYGLCNKLACSHS